jgi:pimeloyl-ACP methyl ester carboxylesterase
MNQNAKHTYVLVAGAWHGGWAWRDVIPSLREMGHTVTAPTLTGLGERRHQAVDQIGLSTHIEDVIAHIEMEDLLDITLVGWSYGGMVVSGVSARMSERIKSMIYLDAFFPESGKALVDYVSAEQRAVWDLRVTSHEPLPAIPLEAFGIADPAIVNFITPRLTPQPWRTFYEPVPGQPSQDKAVSYVYCSGWGPTPFTQFYEKLRTDPRARTAVIETGHMCMFSEPQKTIDLLVSLA